MRASDFSSSAPGRLTKTVGGAVAFVPEPLPTDHDLEVKTVRLLAAAENSLGRLAGTNAREFNSPYVTRRVRLSSLTQTGVAAKTAVGHGSRFVVGARKPALCQGRSGRTDPEM